MVSLRTLWLFCLPFSSVWTEVLVNTAESVFTLSPSADIIAFSNFTTNNPLDNLKDFPETFDIHEFSLNLENGTARDPSELLDQLAVESKAGEQVILHDTKDNVTEDMQISTSSSFSQSVVRVTLPYPTVQTYAGEEETTQSSDLPHSLDSDVFSSLYEGVGTSWSEEEGEKKSSQEDVTETQEFDSELYEVVTSNKGLVIPPREENKEEENQKYENLLIELQKKYGEISQKDAENQEPAHYENHHDEEQQQYLTHRSEYLQDMKHPLIMLMKIEPHALDLLVKPRNFVEGTMVRLMYERVPRNRPAMMQHLDDPVIEYVPLHWPAQHHRLQDLPMGKYIVCGEAHMEGHIIQANCFETVIDRLDNNMLQGGVVGVICVAIISIFLVIVYAIYYRLTRNQRHLDKQGNPESGGPD